MTLHALPLLHHMPNNFATRPIPSGLLLYKSWQLALQPLELFGVWKLSVSSEYVPGLYVDIVCHPVTDVTVGRSSKTAGKLIKKALSGRCGFIRALI